MGTARVIELRNQGQVQFFEGSNGSEKIVVQAPASLSADRTITLPGTAPSAGQFIQSDGSGNWTYANGSATLQSAYDAGNSIVIGSSEVLISKATNGTLLKLASGPGATINFDIATGTSDFVISAVGSGTVTIGTVSANHVELQTSNTVRMHVDSGGSIGIGTTSPDAGGLLTVTGAGIVLGTNNTYYRGKTAAAATVDVAGIDASDQLCLGGAAGRTIVAGLGGQSVVIGPLAVTSPGILDVGGTTSGSLVVRSTTAIAASHTQSVIFTTGTAAVSATTQTGELKATVTVAGGHTTSKLQSRVAFDNATLDGFTIDPYNGGSDWKTSIHGWNGSALNIQHTDVTTVTLSGALSDASNLLPAMSIVLGFSVYTTTNITFTGGGTTIDIGVPGDLTRYANGTNAFVLAGTSWNSLQNSGGTETSPTIYRTLTSLRFTPSPSGSFNTGEIHVVAHYISLTNLTS